MVCEQGCASTCMPALFASALMLVSIPYAPLTADVVENDGSVSSQGKYFSIEEVQVKGELYLNTKNSISDEESIINDNEIDATQINVDEIKKTTLNNNQA